jgi:3-deoxy-manno-octulosonate cytidylyltransferase (CMP-KDO synthetase)
VYQLRIGLYVYRCAFLHEYLQWAPCPLEEVERLEQLRVLWYGRRMHVKSLNKAAPHGVLAPEDLARL